MGLLMMLIGFLFFAGILIFVAWVIMRLVQHPGGTVGESPLDIAKKRYARGEISQEDYERMKTELT